MARPDKIELAPGVLLVAPPMLADPNFWRAVVLLCEHTDEGSFGLILNRHVSLEMTDVVEELASYSAPIHIGGPVQVNTLHFLHRLGDDLYGGVNLFDDVFWGGEFEQLQEIVADGSPGLEGLRFYLGYAGWTTEQLEEEVDAGGWIITRPDVDLVFTDDPANLWRKTLRRMGGEYSVLANFPDDPRMN